MNWMKWRLTLHHDWFVYDKRPYSHCPSRWKWWNASQFEYSRKRHQIRAKTLSASDADSWSHPLSGQTSKLANSTEIKNQNISTIREFNWKNGPANAIQSICIFILITQICIINMYLYLINRLHTHYIYKYIYWWYKLIAHHLFNRYEWYK